jgi:hypothetical protein
MGARMYPPGIIVRPNSGPNTGNRPRINFIQGANITIVCADDPADDEIEIVISCAGCGATSLPAGYVQGSKFARTGVAQVQAGTAAATSYLKDALNTYNIQFVGLLTANMPADLDAGAEAASTWYAVYVIADSAAVNPTKLLYSTNFVSPALPGGYDKYRRVGSVYNDAGSNFLDFVCHGEGILRRYRYYETRSNTQILNSGNSTSIVDVTVVFIPPTSREVYLSYEFYNTQNDNHRAIVLPKGSPESLYSSYITTKSNADGGLLENLEGSFFISTDTSQTIQYRVLTSTSDSLSLYVIGFFEEL